jgi:hypothetical protein
VGAEVVEAAAVAVGEPADLPVEALRCGVLLGYGRFGRNISVRRGSSGYGELGRDGKPAGCCPECKYDGHDQFDNRHRQWRSLASIRAQPGNGQW